MEKQAKGNVTEPLNAPLDEGYPGIAHDMETLRDENQRLRALNAELRAALERIRDYPVAHNMTDGGDSAIKDCVQIARAALFKAKP